MNPEQKIRDDVIARMVNDLTVVAKEFHNHQTLRIRLGDVVKGYLA